MAKSKSGQKDADLNQPMLTIEEVAQFVALTRGQLLDLIRRGRGPRAYKFGHKTFRFTQADIDGWLKEHAV